MKKSSKIILIILVSLFLFCGTPVALVVYGVIRAASRAAAMPPPPGKLAFDNADNLIKAYKGFEGFGNSEQARLMAVDFSLIMTTITNEAFTGGKESTWDKTKDHVLTYCQLTPGNCIFIVQIPKLSQYKDDVRQTLQELAWMAAQRVARKHASDTKMLGVGLRGIILYGPIQLGPPDDKPTFTGDNDTKVLYPFFDVRPATLAATRPAIAPETSTSP